MSKIHTYSDKSNSDHRLRDDIKNIRIVLNQMQEVGSGYTSFSNLSTDRTCDADATTVAELADILGTLIEDLKSAGILTT